MKILAIHNILWSHYKARVFRGLHERLSVQGTRFFVVQLAYSERSRLALKADLGIHQYPYTVLFPEHAIEDIPAAAKVSRLLGEIRKFGPDLVYLNGYYDLAYWFVLAYCKATGTRLVIDFESNEASRKRIWWKESAKKLFLRNCDGLVCLGTKAAEYALKLNVPKEKILSTRNVGVDNDALLEIFDREYPLREKRKSDLGLPAYNLIYAGRFVERKNLIALVRAFHDAKAALPNGGEWGLILSGEGSEKANIERVARELDEDSVCFLEPCEWYEVPIRYTLGDVAVLPSTFEPFGFVTNEAMVFSMPVLVSNRCGSAADLVVDGHNGFQFDPFQSGDLLGKLSFIMTNTHRYAEWGANGKKRIGEWAPDRITDELISSFTKSGLNVPING